MSIPTIAIIVAAIIVVAILITVCYRKAPPTEAIVVTGLGHKEPKVVCGKGVLVIPFIQRADSLNMRVLKIDIKTPQTGVKTQEGVPVWVDSVVTVQVYSANSTITEADLTGTNLTAEQFIQARQQAAISNFLGMKEEDINAKINDVLQGNLREIISELTVDDVLNRRKDFGAKVMENARPDLAKMGLEVVTFTIQDIKDAVDSCGESHGVIEAIGIEKEMEIKRKAEIAKAQATRDITIAKADAQQKANEAEVASSTAIAQKNNELAIKKAALKAEADKAAVDAEAAGEIQKRIQDKTIKEREVEAQIAQQEKAIVLAAKQAEVEQNKLDAEVKKKADAELYRRQREAEAAQFEAERKAEAAKFAKEQEAAGIRMVAEAEAEGIRKKGLAEAEAMQKKAEAYERYGKAAMTEMIVKVLPQVAEQVAAPLKQIDKITIFGDSSNSGIDSVAGNVPTVLAQTFATVKEATGVDLADIVNASSYDAKVNRNVNVSGLEHSESNHLIDADSIVEVTPNNAQADE